MRVSDASDEEKTHTPLVSVVISAYNHETTIRQAIDSVINQTFPDFELIITDDGSTDRTREIIRETVAACKDARIRCDLRETNSCFACVEEAYSNALGKYIAGIGGDDAMCPEKLEKQVRFLENCDEVYQACFTWVIAEGDEENRERARDYEVLFNRENMETRDLWLQMLRTNCLCAPSVLIRRDVFLELGGYDFTMRQLQDYELWLHFLMKYRLYILPEPLTIYRATTGSISDVKKSETANARTAVEGEEILFEVIRDMPTALFAEVFPDEDPTHNTEIDICCRKVKAVFERARAVADFTIALRLFYAYRKIPGFRELFAKRYGYTRRIIHQAAGETSVYAAVQHWMKEAGG